jgi:nucleoside-diphosphate kinase
MFVKVSEKIFKAFKENVMERTLSIIKPDGVAKGLIGEILRRFESNGLKIRAMKMIALNKKQAEGFYDVHREKPFFNSVTDFMSSGPCVVLILEGDGAIEKNRKLMGATDYTKAEPGTIRADFASNIERNIVHGSDGPETARYEIGYFFNALEQVD